MTYTPQTWTDHDPLKPVSAARMLHIESGVEDADVRLDLVEAWFSSVGATFTLVGSLLTNVEVGAVGPSFGFLSLRHSGAGVGLKESNFSTQAGKTTLTSVNDAGTVTIKRGLEMDHATGVVDFPNGLTSGGAGLGSVFDSRGKSIIATTESRTNVAFGTLTTPDQVTVTLAADGLIKVLYQATWQESVNGAARAAIFVDANELMAAEWVSTAPQLAGQAAIGSNAGNKPLHTKQTGLRSGFVTNDYGGDVTTGQVVGNTSDNTGGPCYIFAAAGTYTISIQFKSSSGSVTAQGRKLWVAAETY